MLVAWATILSLERLQRYQDQPQMVTFHWRQIEGAQPYNMSILFENEESFFSLLTPYFQALGVHIERTQKK